MGKYLIEDIIPPGKKNRAPGVHHDEHAEATTATPTHHATRAVHHTPKVSHVSASPEDLHPHAKHAVAHHAAKKRTQSHEDAAHEEEHGHEEAHIIDEMSPEMQDPKMILREEVHEELPHPAEAAPVTPAYFEEAPLTKPTEGAWPYNATGTKPPYIPPTRYETNEGSFWRTWMPWILIPAIIGIVVIFAFNMFFAGATVTVLPKHDNIPMDNKFSAEKNPAMGGLSFAVMKVTLEDTREVPATGEKTVTAKASGRIIVYNKQTNAQRLIKNTRFQATSGKIYRIADSIDVPKAKVVSGKTTPGSLEVTVYADEAGPDFNSDPTDFTLPGLKGSPTFDKVYARSKGPLAGGASGTIKSVSDLDLKQAGEDLRVQLETKLRTKARGDLSPNQIGYDQGIVVELSEPTLSKNAASSPDKAVVTESGTLYMITFDRKELTTNIVRTLVPTYSGEAVSIKNLDAMQPSFPPMKGADLWAANELDFSIKGTAEVEWIVNQDDVKKVLLGIPKENFNAILKQFTTIERAKATIRPVWMRSFPDDATKITVEIVSSMPK